MHLDEVISVACTDTGKSLPGTVVRMRGDWVDVSIGDLLISLKRTKPGLWVGSRAGMEFVIHTD
jgi:hypothetical protein